MNRRRHRGIPNPDSPDIDAALAAMDADALRDLVRDLLPRLDELTHGRVVDELIDRATRSDSGWTPNGPDTEKVAAIVAFAEAAKRNGCAEPAAVNCYLREGTNALFGRDPAAAVEILRALLGATDSCRLRALPGPA